MSALSPQTVGLGAREYEDEAVQEHHHHMSCVNHCGRIASVRLYS